ncbi:cytochrome P450 [Streptosporangium minutum]|uniref:Cytochrome P450 n=1 Tax=Streptosporangium minutum TaxID=569862 RepID=A0A243RLT9_9ACTN|nr:cytochrome P450 [Streptosporangium minutum]OUC95845.1 cytochrome P450 [Streptosporangium minutum]
MSDTGQQAPHYPFPAPSALEPPQEWARLREGCPVAPIRLASGDEALLLTRYADVKQLLSDPRFTHHLVADDAANITANESGGVFGSGGTNVRGDAHREWRKLIGKAFTAKRVSAMQPRIEAMAEHLVDEMIKQGPSADLAAGLGFPLPVWVICDLLGVPDADRDKFAYWSDTLLSLTKFAQDEIDAAQADFAGYMRTHVTAKRAEPGDDLISELISLVGALDGQVTEEVTLMTAKGLLVAGHETTANMIGKMVAMLLADRTRWEQLLADPALIRPAVEECLRHDANFGFGIPRYISEEVKIADTTLPAGTTVVCSLSSANRDERAFDHAADMDLTRSPNPHLIFGAGPYSCLGQSLARTELQTVLKVLLDRLPTLALAVPADALERREGLVVGGLQQVPVTW